MSYGVRGLPLFLDSNPKFSTGSYTHYWSSPRDPETWERIWPQLVADAASIADLADVPLQGGIEDENPPLISLAEGFRVNGVGADGHETFTMNPSGSGSDCKTAGKRTMSW